MLRLYENFNNLTYKGLFMTEEKKNRIHHLGFRKSITTSPDG